MSFQPLRALAPAKINLGLFVGPPRPDGRHELVSVMQSISLADELTLEPIGAGAEGDELRCPGVEGPAAENLSMRALSAFREATGWDAGAVRLTVVKRVPVAAGLGGGSGDAAATLRLAAAASGLGEQETLMAIAAGLGADVPAQVQPGRWLATGAGERLTALPDPGPFGVLVLPSDEALSTAAVYGELDRGGELCGAAELRERERELRAALGAGEALPAAGLLRNDLQPPALSLCPAIGDALERASASGADVALLSGSGPTVLGLFGGEEGPARAERAAQALAGRSPAPIAAIPVDASFGRPAPLR